MMDESGANHFAIGWLLVAGSVVLLAAMWLALIVFSGAMVMLSFAAEQGFLRPIAFAARWRERLTIRNFPSSPNKSRDVPPDDPAERYRWANRSLPYDEWDAARNEQSS